MYQPESNACEDTEPIIKEEDVRTINTGRGADEDIHPSHVLFNNLILFYKVLEFKKVFLKILTELNSAIYCSRFLHFLSLAQLSI